MMEKPLIVNVEKLKADSYLDSNVTNNDIRVAVLLIQDQIIEHVLGSCLYDKIMYLTENCMIDNCDYKIYKELLDDYLFPIFTYAVPAQLTIPKSFKIRNVGTVQQSGDNFQQTAIGEVKYLSAYYRNNADFYMHRAIKFLKCNKECFPELCCCECSWCADSPFSKNPTTSLNLNKVRVKRWI